MQNFITVPFKAESAHGITQIDGMAKFSPAGIILEFESKIIGLINTGVKEVRLPIAEIFDVKFRKGFFKRGAKIEIRMKSMLKLSEMPNQDGKIILKLKADDFELGADAVERLQKEMAGVKELEPPMPHSPVSRMIQENDSEDETKKL